MAGCIFHACELTLASQAVKSAKAPWYAKASLGPAQDEHSKRNEKFRKMEVTPHYSAAQRQRNLRPRGQKWCAEVATVCTRWCAITPNTGEDLRHEAAWNHAVQDADEPLLRHFLGLV